MTVLTLSAKGLNPTVNYQPFKKVEFNKEEVKPVFHKVTPKQGVRQKNIQKLKKMGILTLALGTVALIPDVTFASPLMGGAVEATALPSESATKPIDPNITLDPSKVMGWGLRIGLVALGLSFTTTVAFLTFAAIVKQFGKKEFSKEWRNNVISGFIQALVAIPVTYAIWSLATILFSNLGHLKGIF